MTSKPRPKLKDIAKELHVSPTTVSFVLNGKGKEKNISDVVIKKIEDYIKEIGYQPHTIAQSLRTGRSRILVLMVEDISNPFFSRIARIIEDIAHTKGYKIVFCSNENDDLRSRELIKFFLERSIDGFFIVPSAGIRSTIQSLIDHNIPVVLFDRYFEGLPVSHVIIDNEKAAYDATAHLIKNNFKKIVFLTTDSEQTQMLNRQQGYEKAIKQVGYKPYLLKLPFTNVTAVNIQKAFLEKFETISEIDSIFFSTNYLTKGGIEFLKKTDPQLIHKLGIVTFDDNDFFNIYTPTITAVSQPLEKIGRAMMKIMLDILQRKKGQAEIQHKIFPAELIVRESSGPKLHKENI
ncbi:LacI family transcriptional regulator [Sinomicrobium pectinilyticum]|uniref:LacI family transcriptional regulator n=1 Tax=Sinomicrobium pectinilyticum TaxID=1084421 RepID=A0A3N0EHK1_SINP1|nr:LacI family DNA-binding transcriptional regulator [Sinomicrobium pectinilyticum]RNL87264.1 LacI family transcriptional regulator [Sinomicrobium pectinilyticum]